MGYGRFRSEGGFFIGKLKRTRIKVWAIGLMSDMKDCYRRQMALEFVTD